MNCRDNLNSIKQYSSEILRGVKRIGCCNTNKLDNFMFSLGAVFNNESSKTEDCHFLSNDILRELEHVKESIVKINCTNG